LAVSHDGNLLASAGEDRTIRLWDLKASGKQIRAIDGHAEPIRSVAFSPDGRTLASSSDDKTIKLWDIATGEPKTTFKGHKYRVWSLGFTPTGEHLLSASLVIRIWHAPRK
jgi:WD40 repeat protein